MSYSFLHRALFVGHKFVEKHRGIDRAGLVGHRERSVGDLVVRPVLSAVEANRFPHLRWRDDPIGAGLLAEQLMSTHQ